MAALTNDESYGSCSLSFDMGFGDSDKTNSDKDITSQGSSKISKKRKIDKDGFVTPATPKLNRSLMSNEEKQQENNDQKLSENGTFSIASEDPSLYPADKPMSKENGNMAMNSDKNAHSNTAQKPISEVVKEMGLEMKLVYNHWSRSFMDSVNFENFCESRLDKLLQQALRRETFLKQQKVMLSQRLQSLSKTLQE